MSDARCDACKHWERFEPRDQGGNCDLGNELTFEDDRCPHFARALSTPEGERE